MAATVEEVEGGRTIGAVEKAVTIAAVVTVDEVAAAAWLEPSTTDAATVAQTVGKFTIHYMLAVC